MLLIEVSMENINPQQVYTDKELQNNYVKIKDGDEVIAVIIPFYKSSINLDTDANSINVSELIEEETELPETEPFDENSEAKQRGDFRRRINEKQYVPVSDGGKSVYTETFVVSSISKI